MKTLIVINAAHSLFPQQAEICGDAELFKLSENGVTAPEVPALAAQIIARADKEEREIVFASPFLALVLEVCRQGARPLALHNDKRDAKEVPDGKGGVRIIHSVSPTGWQLF